MLVLKKWDFVNKKIFQRKNKITVSQFKKIKIKRILIIFWGRLGELILSTMLLKILRRTYKKAYITYIIGSNGTEILKNDPNVDRLISANRRIYKNIIKNKPYDLAIDLYGGKESGFMVYLSGAKYCILSSKLRKNAYFTTIGIKATRYKSNNVKDHFLNMAHTLGINIKDTENIMPSLSITKKEELFAKKYIRKLNLNKDDFIVGLHPGGNYELWPEFKYAELGRHLVRDLQAKILIFQGPKQKTIARRVKSLMSKQAILLPYLYIREYVAVLSKCKLFITNAGGASHVGPALGIPTVIILTDKEYQYWIPYGKKSVYLPIRSQKKSNHKNKKQMRQNFELNISVKQVSNFITSQEYIKHQ